MPTCSYTKRGCITLLKEFDLGILLGSGFNSTAHAIFEVFTLKIVKVNIQNNVNLSFNLMNPS